MITRVEGREIRTKKRVNGWAGWTPVSEGVAVKFQEFVLCKIEDGEGLVLLHERLAKATVEIKATTTSAGNKKMLCA